MRTLWALLPRASWFYLVLFCTLSSTIAFEAYATYILYAVNAIEMEREPGGVLWMSHIMWAGNAVLFGALYGFHRARYFHPLLQLDYLAWLRTTPWDGTQRLVLGPIGLVWQDAVLLAFPIVFALWSSLLNVLYVLTAFLAMFTLVHTATIHTCGHRLRAFVALLLIAASIAFLSNPYFCVLFVAMACMIVVESVLRGLPNIANDAPRFPNTEFAKSRVPFQSVQNSVLMQTGSQFAATNGPALDRVGWPIAILAARSQWNGLSRARVLEVTVILAAYVYAITHFADWFGLFNDVSKQREVATLTALAVTLGIGMVYLVRVSIYAMFCAPPIGIIGRFALRTLIIPSYDRMWMIPLLGPVAAFSATYWGTRIFGLGPLPITAGFSLGTLLVLMPGPTFDEWFTSAKMRLRESPAGQANVLFRI